jgi:HTH-type transcriptional regulator/antitoxin HigA
MHIEPIKSEADYEKALHRVEFLWDAEPGRPEKEELDVLVTLVEAYEDQHYPIDPPSRVDSID